MSEYIFEKIRLKRELKLCVVLSEETERVLVGTQKEIQRVLFTENEEYTELLVDVTRPYGSAIIDFERDEKHEWESVLSYMDQANTVMNKKVRTDFFGQSEVLKIENKIKKILKQKYDTKDPICQYAAIILWENYWRVRGKEDEVYEAFSVTARNFIRPFVGGLNQQPEVNVKLYRENPVYRWVAAELDDDSKYPIFQEKDKSGAPYIIAQWSLIPVKRFYAEKTEEARYALIKCGICGKLFVSPTLRNKYCSDFCKKRGAEISKKSRFTNDLLEEQDRICRRAYQTWDNEIKRVKKSGKYSQEQIDKLEVAFFTFCKEKNALAKQCREGKLELRELQNNLAESYRDLDKMILEMNCSR